MPTLILIEMTTSITTWKALHATLDPRKYFLVYDFLIFNFICILCNTNRNYNLHSISSSTRVNGFDILLTVHHNIFILILTNLMH